MGKKKAIVKPKPALEHIALQDADGYNNGFPAELNIRFGEKERLYVPKDDQFWWCFQFTSWLETLPKGAVGGATQLLRKFLIEKELYD